MATYRRMPLFGVDDDVSVECPGCVKTFHYTEDTFEIPCGHCLCKSCAMDLASKTVQQCPNKECKSHKVSPRRLLKLKFEDFPSRPASALDRNSIVLPPPEQERPNSPSSVASSIRSHPEFASVVYCEKHPASAIRYFCHICEVELCEECWKDEHDEDDYRKHNIGFIKVNLEPQKEIQKRIVENQKDCQKMSRILEDWKAIVRQAQIAENKQNEVLKASTANQLEQKSDIVRNLIQNHITDVRKFKETILNELEELERKQRCIFGDVFDSDYDSFLNRSCSTPVGTIFSSRSSDSIEGDDNTLSTRSSSPSMLDSTMTSAANPDLSATEGASRVESSEGRSKSAVGGGGNGHVTPVQPNRNVALRRGKKRELVRVTHSAIGDEKIDCLRAVYNTATKEVICYNGVYKLTVFRINRPNGKFEVSKRMKLKSDANNYLMDITLDSNNSLYGVIWNKKTRVNRVAVLDIMKNKELIEERKLLDTKRLHNGGDVYWRLCAVGETVAVVVEHWRRIEDDYNSVTLYRSHIRQQYVQLNIRGIFTGLCPHRNVLVNENTLLLASDDRTIAVVSLPSQQTTTTTTSAHTSKLTSNTSQKLQPKSIKYIEIWGIDYIWSFFWIPSEESVQSHAAEGYLFATNIGGSSSYVYKINLETDMAKVAEGEERTIAPMEGIGRLNDSCIQCSIDSSTLFAITKGISGKPMLLNLEYKTP